MNPKNPNYNYILHHKTHYHYVKNIVPKTDTTMGKHKRGLLAFDFETRRTEDWVFVGKTKSYYIKDTICKAVYQGYKKEACEVATFLTHTEGNKKSSARQFLDWLLNERAHNRYYTCIAHNGSRFDFYLLIAEMTTIRIQKWCKKGFNLYHHRGGDASSDDAATGGGITGGRSNNRNASPESAVKAVDESQKRWKPLGNANVIGAVAISASWPIFFAAPAMEALPGGAASWRSRFA